MLALQGVDLVSLLAGGGAIMDCLARGTADEGDCVVVKEQLQQGQYFHINHLFQKSFVTTKLTRPGVNCAGVFSPQAKTV